ncbi:hypothetical protein [Bacillus sp. J14TS2]|uniref:hypothetical protein n=1 Tax=Bacillus sp. J14TS2 TaxID=2807188 RepID=UPI001BB306DA|nr:hypothetical protein [Bacillus sp. J14TS2]
MENKRHFGVFFISSTFFPVKPNLNAKVEMEHLPDYRFSFHYKNPNIEAKAVLYEFWISPNKDKVEPVIDAESKYAQLDKNESALLFELSRLK